MWPISLIIFQHIFLYSVVHTMEPVFYDHRVLRPLIIFDHSWRLPVLSLTLNLFAQWQQILRTYSQWVVAFMIVTTLPNGYQCLVWSHLHWTAENIKVLPNRWPAGNNRTIGPIMPHAYLESPKWASPYWRFGSMQEWSWRGPGFDSQTGQPKNKNKKK